MNITRARALAEDLLESLDHFNEDRIVNKETTILDMAYELGKTWATVCEIIHLLKEEE